MLYGLLLTALLMGLGGLPHCATMCAAPCAAGLPGGLPWPALLGRMLGYAGLGAVAAAMSSGLSAWSRWASALQPFWVMGLAATILLGAWMAIQGRLPRWIEARGQAAYRRLQDASSPARSPQSHQGRWARRATAMLLGSAWAALPCGLLYSAVVVATLAPSAAGGALVMAVFSLPGGVVLYGVTRALGPWSRTAVAPAPQAAAGAPVLWLASAASAASAARSTKDAPAVVPSAITSRLPWLADPAWAVRASGAMLAAAAVWALAHRLHEQWLAWCA